MRKLQYRLSNGTVVKSLYEAEESGLGYQSEVVDVEPSPSLVSPLRANLLATIGYVAPSRKGAR